jgi:ribosomal protein S18 acetylase RimI-like enzyme
MTIEIRVVGPDDLTDLLPLMRGYCEFYGTSPADEELIAMSRRFLGAGDTDGTQLIARDDAGRAVGHATILWTWDTTLATPLAVMEDLYVAAGARGTGVGRSLIAACCDAAASRGIAALDWVTAPDNLTAQRLYDSTGARRSDWISYRLPTPMPEP